MFTTTDIIGLATLLLTSVSAGVGVMSFHLNARDYAEDIAVTASEWPLKRMLPGKGSPLYLAVSNASRESLSYRIMVTGLGFCISDTEKTEILRPCAYRSPLYRLTRTGTTGQEQTHLIYLQPVISRADINNIAYISEPHYSFNLRVITASGTVLYDKTCYYYYQPDAVKFYDPEMDTSGNAGKMKDACL